MRTLAGNAGAAGYIHGTGEFASVQCANIFSVRCGLHGTPAGVLVCIMWYWALAGHTLALLATYTGQVRGVMFVHEHALKFCSVRFGRGALAGNAGTAGYIHGTGEGCFQYTCVVY
mgnify:CR=1 FL=1